MVVLAFLSSNPNVIAQVEQLPRFEASIADHVFLEVDPQQLPVLLQVREAGLAHQQDRHDASRNVLGDARSFQYLRCLPVVRGQGLRHGVNEVVLPRISGTKTLHKRIMRSEKERSDVRAKHLWGESLRRACTGY